MKITKEFLQWHHACTEGFKWVSENNLLNLESDLFIRSLMKARKYDWSNWLMARLLTRNNKVRYAIYASEQVLEIYEKKYPKDKRPQEAIRAAKRCIKRNTEKNRTAANAANAANAAYAAYAAANAAEGLQIKILKYGLKLLKADND